MPTCGAISAIIVSLRRDAICSPNLIGSHASLPKNSDVALSVIPEDYIELLRCSGERHRALLLHSRANVRDIHRLRDVLTDLVEDRLRNRPWQYWNGQEQGSAARITLACASPFAFRIWPLAHRDLDDVAQPRRVAEHLVQDSDAFGDADIEAGNGPRVGGSIEKTFGLRAPQYDVDGSFDAGGSLGDDTKDL